MRGGEIGIREFHTSCAEQKYLEGRPGGHRGSCGWLLRLTRCEKRGSAEARIEAIQTVLNSEIPLTVSVKLLIRSRIIVVEHKRAVETECSVFAHRIVNMLVSSLERGVYD